MKRISIASLRSLSSIAKTRTSTPAGARRDRTTASSFPPRTSTPTITSLASDCGTAWVSGASFDGLRRFLVLLLYRAAGTRVCPCACLGSGRYRPDAARRRTDDDEIENRGGANVRQIGHLIF